ncbi:type IV inositol polyphosphate 5-phosphatase 3 [Heracleum sosnowskyi]|uniref:Type IV inositol polyphosphate 5-phosphatase 3 n=1 Tax=Heracleum sosnowskyi TaxID=360622 RepID=A0AAD8HQ83_9APIA|nr:type IV inositol polyphosphate 5-phosphatase 3 [Heracleum sosnowskyi]
MKLVQSSKNHHELGMVVRKLLNMKKKQTDYNADEEEEEEDDLNSSSTDSDTEAKLFEGPTQSKFKNYRGGEVTTDPLKEALPRLQRRNSEMLRAQYIKAKEVRVHACTWNVGGELPPDDLDIEEWLDISEPADIYVIGFQEIIPLNAGNIFGTEDSRPIPKWENIIRRTLNKTQPVKENCKCYSDPPSPSKFKPSKDFPHLEDEVLLDTEFLDFSEDIDELITGQEVLSTDAASFPTFGANLSLPHDEQLSRYLNSPKKLEKLHCFRIKDSEGASEPSFLMRSNRIRRPLSKTEVVGLSWAEPPLDLLAQCTLDRPNYFKSFKASRYLRTFNPFKSSITDDSGVHSDAAYISKVGLELLVKRKRRSRFVRILSKQMVGIFITVWASRSLRRGIQNVNVSTVGVGAMGYIGNKGSISVSMTIYQNLYCFICTHLSSGEKEEEAIKRNADVRAIHRKTQFSSFSGIALLRSIYDHERIIWLGDLNYRINLPYDETQQLVSRRDWSELVEYDQLVQEFRKGKAFDGWSEGTLNFPPTYKYELNSEKFYGEDPKFGRRTPAWCDRIISHGKGMKLMSYRSTDLRLSDHRPVSASYTVEVEVFSPKRLQKALLFTDAEIEHDEFAAGLGLHGGVSRLGLL